MNINRKKILEVLEKITSAIHKADLTTSMNKSKGYMFAIDTPQIIGRKKKKKKTNEEEKEDIANVDNEDSRLIDALDADFKIEGEKDE